jgi:L-alanine-DL-glutamate epimerase-like enolase superfamily enzyme
MKIVAIRERSVPIGSAMRNASISFSGMTASALAIVTDRVIDGAPVIGYAFDSIGRYAKGGLLRERFIPRLLDGPADSLLDAEGLPDPQACWNRMMRDEKEGGHGERSGAVGLLDAALWDLRAKLRGEPLWRTLARESGHAGAQPVIATYGSCGHFQPGADTQALRDELRAALDLGYRTVKIKVDGCDLAVDAPRIEAALAEVGQGNRLAIDANGHADTQARGWLNAISAYGLAWIEEPVGPLDYAGLARFAQAYPGVIATGENLFSAADARNLLLYGGLRAGHDRIQIDMLLSYGLPEYRRVLDMYAQKGWPRAAFWPHAGHLFAAHVVAGFGLGSHEAAPDATRLYGGFWDGTRIEDGQLRIPDIPGVGYEAKQNLYAVLRELVQ